MGTGGCLTGSLNASDALSPSGSDQTNQKQRYGEYLLQYMDYNGNGDPDGGTPGNEDGIGTIIGDEDDRDIGDGPEVLSGSTPELYLYDPKTRERTFFRWTYKVDPNMPGANCTNGTQSGCLGNVEMLKLKGYDIGLSHSGQLAETGSAFDGKIDTWLCRPEWKCTGPLIT